MKCYEHPGVEAIGVCAVCKRGVCRASEVIVHGKRFCNDHARGELRSEARAESLERRGFALTGAAVLSVIGGLWSVVIGFLLLVLGMLGPEAQGSSIVSTTVQPFTSYFGAVLMFPTGEILLVGLLSFVAGTVDMVSGYLLWRRSKLGAVISVIAAIFGPILTSTYLEIIALAGGFTFVFVPLALVEIVLVAVGWKHLN